MPPFPLVTGIIAPTQVFFHQDTEELDLETIGKHAVRLARAGIAGIATNGSNGEAVYLSVEERAKVTKTTRQALDSSGFSHVPIMVGASDQSVAGTLRLCHDAAASGGDTALIMVPSFYKWAMDAAAMERYFKQVADGSPLPIVIYNYPAAVAGIDLDSDMIERLASHPNIIGVKFTCGNVGKLARVARSTHPITETCPEAKGTRPFYAYAGIADFILPAVAVGGSGAIVGAANVFPRACVNMYKLAIQGREEEARQVQQQLAQADWSLTRRAIPGFKAILQHYHGYGGVPRQPMAALTSEEASQLCEEIRWMMDIELALPDATSSVL
ncbi:Aldolase-type TIM barrel [Fusarium beomiforme]|uniref:Aldolase-type TIM barrel n=1 Tax=Fusarium beomiforme TaxID=44412 RepID=A0A9P5AC21_9HYPO|nr:Aldolase-type TIM barrel [Fusarium beomiforme]